MSKQPLDISTRGNQIILDSQRPAVGEWEAHWVDENRIVATSKPMIDGSTDFGILDTSVFASLLISLTAKKWSGVIAVDSGESVQRIYFRDGGLCFAGSSLMDHRLGEVVYRKEGLDLDQLTDFTVQVTKEKKFGQILMESGVFDATDLWVALQNQVTEILRYVLSLPKVSVELKEGKNLASTEIDFDKSTAILIAEVEGSAAAVRAFSELISPDTLITIKGDPSIDEGHFQGDFLSLVKEAGTSEKTFEMSKLDRINTIIVIMDFIQRGLLDLGNLPQLKLQRKPEYHLFYKKLDLFTAVLSKTQEAFQGVGKDFPIKELHTFLSREFDGWCLFMDDNGMVAKHSMYFMHKQAESNGESLAACVNAMSSLVDFLLQLTMDMVGFKQSKAIRSELCHD